MSRMADYARRQREEAAGLLARPNRVRSGLADGGRWIRTFGTATQKPGISEAFRASRAGSSAGEGDVGGALAPPSSWLSKWQSKYSRLCDWVEENIEETLTYFRLPLPHHKHMKSTNMLERLNPELKRRTHVVRLFPNAESCLRLVRALAVETHENWLEGTRYLNMDHLTEHKKEALRRAA